MNNANTAQVKIGRVWQSLVSSVSAPEPKTLPRQRRRAIAYTIALRAVNKEYRTIVNGVTSFTVPRKARHRIARAASKQAMLKHRLNVAMKKED